MVLPAPMYTWMKFIYRLLMGGFPGTLVEEIVASSASSSPEPIPVPPQEILGTREFSASVCHPTPVTYKKRWIYPI